MRHAIERSRIAWRNVPLGVVNTHQCNNCDLRLVGDNLIKIVASF